MASRALIITASWLAAVSATDEPSLGTLLHCSRGEAACGWADGRGAVVSRDAMLARMLSSRGLDVDTASSELKRLERHALHVEGVLRDATARGLELSYRLGVTDRHLYLDHEILQTPEEFVEQEIESQRRRRLEPNPSQRQLQSLRASLNWCSTDNPLGKSVCSPVKSQSTCGSCWSFATSDAIETAVAIQSNSTARALSPQQFLDCSHRQMQATFSYCWATAGSQVDWLKTEMKWASKNNGCDGSMTHAAFMDAAQLQMSLLSELELPYAETKTELTLVPGLAARATTAPRSEAERNRSCVRNPDKAVASITGWEQAVGKDCSTTKDPTQLLKLALQKQPVSVAATSRGTFKEYKGGIYECPNNGDLTDSSWIDHALVLVGYGSEKGVDYWIIKNSFGSSWGECGFMRLRMDKKLNCGLNVFPVIPIGASKGSAKLTIDSGGAVEMLGLSPTAWILVAVTTTLVTAGLTVAGTIVARRQRLLLQKQEPAMQ